MVALLLFSVVWVFAAKTTPETAENKEYPLKLAGNCPDFPRIAALDNSKLSGEWFVAHSYRQTHQSSENDTEIIRCMRQSFTFHTDGNLLGTVHFVKGDKTYSESADGTPVDGKRGKFFMSSPEFPGDRIFLTIFSTDYTNYAVIILCQEEDKRHGYMINVLSRQKTLERNILENIKTAIASAKIWSHLMPIKQNC